MLQFLVQSFGIKQLSSGTIRFLDELSAASTIETPPDPCGQTQTTPPVSFTSGVVIDDKPSTTGLYIPDELYEDDEVVLYADSTKISRKTDLKGPPLSRPSHIEGIVSGERRIGTLDRPSFPLTAPSPFSIVSRTLPDCQKQCDRRNSPGVPPGQEIEAIASAGGDSICKCYQRLR